MAVRLPLDCQCTTTTDLQPCKFETRKRLLPEPGRGVHEIMHRVRGEPEIIRPAKRRNMIGIKADKNQAALTISHATCAYG